jgi:hypothetical protein
MIKQNSTKPASHMARMEGEKKKEIQAEFY